MMLKRTSIKSVFVLLVIAAFSLGANAGPLNLSQGTMTAGGVVGFTFNKAAGADFNTMSYGFSGTARTGFFVMNNWDLVFVTGLTLEFNNPGFVFRSVELGLGTNYYFDLGSIIYPYLGVELTVLADSKPYPSNWSVAATPRFGILIGLNCNVALDIGLKAGLRWPLQDDPANSFVADANPSIDAMLGYLGVKAFF